MLACGITLGEDYPDAKALLERLSQKAADRPSADVDETTARFKADVQAFKEKVAKLSPNEAAGEWLALFDRGAGMVPASSNEIDVHGNIDVFFEDGGNSPLRQAFLALPPPDHWPALAKAIEARQPAKGEETARDLGLRLLAGILSNDAAARKKIVDELRANAPATTDDPSETNESEMLAALLGDEPAARDPVAAFEKQIEQKAVQYDSLTVPDLVSLAGKEKSESLLTRALTKTSWTIEPPAGDETRKLARELTLKHVAELKVPQWQLVDSPDAVALYEALDKKFPAKAKGKGLFRRIFGGEDREEDEYGPTSYYRKHATLYYFAGLIAAGRTDDAAVIVRGMDDDEDVFRFSSEELVAAIRKSGSLRRAYEFLHKVITENPSSPLWDAYLKLAAELGKSDEALATARSAAAREALPEPKRDMVQQVFVRALLAADKVDEAIEILRGQLKPAEGERDSDDVALELATLGILLQKPELATEGINAAIERLKKDTRADDRFVTEDRAVRIAHLLAETDRRSEAVEVLIEAMQRMLQVDGQDFASRAESVRPLLIELVSAYHEAGRHKDIVEILAKVPYWGHADLGEFAEETDSQKRPIGYLVAAALAASDRKDDARKILEFTLDIQPGYDPAYALLIDLFPDRDSAIARLDALFEGDKFQERPLIWKADLLRAAGRLDEAEATVRKAIAIDPSDGEQPRGDRMRAYAVLAAILEGKGNAKEAELYHNVVKAIRLAEDADRLFEAGLLRRAVRLYKQSLAIFQDAYCIQSRLAVQLAEMGDIEAAEPHYRKAYELMPDSFGRVESHCFGCEGAFKGPLAQRIAEEVFTRLVKQNPNKPQTHYLLAYLREQQERYKEAVEPLRKAVELDPDYLNAWKTLSGLPTEAGLPAAEREKASLAIIRLDPRQRHSAVDLSRVRDLHALWSAVERVKKFQASRPKSLYTMQAAKAAIDNNGESHVHNRSYAHFENNVLRTPAHALATTPAFQAVFRLLESE
jgi:tetratricopeptide (TPR) repeat protein